MKRLQSVFGKKKKTDLLNEQICSVFTHYEHFFWPVCKFSVGAQLSYFGPEKKKKFKTAGKQTRNDLFALFRQSTFIIKLMS